MDKYEYKVRSEEISDLIEKERYADAVKIADTIDWRRVKSAAMLLKIAALYRVSRRNEDSREMLMLAYERYPTNRSVVYSLCELSIELDDVVAAIEYYKQFVKLAPKDNGVYTLRYRILEAQEASLEERIEILEELKKKDYQEEWAYELAYLYHRVGLSTKCVEECDDIILWFGDGPYVMKAMELKKKHVPLTAAQQQNYDIMLANAGQNYSSANYGTENYDGQNYDSESYDGQNYYAESYDGQNYNVEGYAEQNYNAEDYAEQNYNANGYEEQNYNAEGYTEQNYATTDYDGQNYDAGNYDTQDYNTSNYDAQGYDTVNYNDQGYGESGYVTENDSNDPNTQYAGGRYTQQDYADEQYAGEDYGQNHYSNRQYATGGYGQEDYSNDQYAQNNYVDDGYGNLSYVDGSYQDNSYTSEFYVEQTYDENGNLINPEMYSDSDYAQDHYGYPQGQNTQNHGYAGQTNTSKEYRNGLHLVENSVPPAGSSSDMSQYNTINLQKVVAESMKELFPDDNDDVFAEDREKYNAGQEIKSTVGDTRIFTGVMNPNTAKKKTEHHMDDAEESVGFERKTGRVNVAQMVTGVLEKEPEPHTGAIKKVLVPGDDARSIKSDSDIEELRDTTEKSVDDEHHRMEHNDENVYHEHRMMGEDETEEKPKTTGPMKLDEVLVEWERMKQDNAKKHQEEIKKRVLTQTGKIFADFDNSIKSGILGELEREEKEAQRNNEAEKASRSRESANYGNKKGDGFLDADVTGDLPQQLESDEDFDVEYVAEYKQSKELQKSVDTEQSGKAEDLTDSEFTPDDTLAESMMERESSVYSQEMDTAGVPDQEAYQSAGTSERVTDAYEQEMDGEPELSAQEKSPYTQQVSTDDIEESDTENLSDVEGAYTKAEETYTENDSEDMEEADTEDTDTHTNEMYEESARAYTEAVYAESDSEDAEDTYIENDNEYPGNDIEGLYDEDTSESAEDTYVDENEYYQNGTNEYPDTNYEAETYPEESYEESYSEESYTQELYEDEPYAVESYEEESYDDIEDAYDEQEQDTRDVDRRRTYQPNYQYNEKDLDPEDVESIVEMAKEDALKTQEIKMNTADLSALSERIVATTKKEASGAKREEIRDFTPEEQILFENFAVTKKIKKQIIYALENMTLAAYTGNVIITGDAGLDTVRMAKNLVKVYQASDEGFSGRLAKITGEKINQRNIKDIFEKLNNGGIIIEKANGMSEEKLYELATNLSQDTLGIVVIMEDTKKEITKLLEKQAMIVDYFNIRIDLMEMDNNALVAYAKNYALALEYSIDELGTLALYTRIANMQSGNHVVTKDEVRDIIDEAIWKSKKSKIKNFVDVLFARRYDNEDMIVLKERDFM